MYALNLVGRPVLITPEEVLRKTSTNNNLDSGKLLPGIEIAETRFVQDYDCLGYEYYAALCTEKNRVVTSGNIATLQTLFDTQNGAGSVPLVIGDMVNAAEFLSTNNRVLWDQYLWKLLAECVHFIAIPENYLDFSSQGLMKNNPIASAVASETAKSVGASLSDVKFSMNTWLQERIEPLRASMRRYLLANTGLFPLWASYQNTPEKNSAYVDLSIYRDVDTRRGCCWQGNNPSGQPPRTADCGCDPNDPLSW